ITLFRANQKPQLEDGADPSKMLVIANGVNIGHYAALTHPRSASATVALIGRVVPIKDIKTFLRACAIIKQEIPDFFAYILGPTDEDEGYYEECLTLVKLLGLDDHVEFTGRVAVEEYLLKIDLMVLTSISEAQPLVMLEAGAAGIPIVATDVGACREIIEGLPEESPALGAGGIVTPLASPVATAEAILTLLADPTRYEAASRAIKQRIAEYYNEGAQNQSYRNLYATYLKRNG
ncbi:MAG: GT4 family glycosyltransferase PelF, partial [Alphaproteobacteria bacterium]